jgi:hypothetical protein
MINKQIKPGVGRGRKPNPMASANSKSTPALFSGGVSELVSFDADGNTKMGKAQKKPFQTSESLTEDINEYSLAKRREKFRTQKPGGPNELGGGLY